MEKSVVASLKEQVTAVVMEIYRAIGEGRKPLRGSPVSEVREVSFRDEQGNNQSGCVVFLSYVFLRENRDLVSKLTNAVTASIDRPSFIVAQRTIIHPKSKYNQKIPNNRTLTSVYEELFQDLVHPAHIVGKRVRFGLGGSRLIKYHLNKESQGFVLPRAEHIKHAYHQLTGRSIALEFRAEQNYAKVPHRRPTISRKAKQTQ